MTTRVGFAIIVFGVLLLIARAVNWVNTESADIASTLAIVWNLTFNHLFEQGEARQSVKGRSVMRRVVHALGFEGGLAMVLIPLMAWWFGVTLWEATVMEAGLLVFFLVYTYVFNW